VRLILLGVLAAAGLVVAARALHEGPSARPATAAPMPPAETEGLLRAWRGAVPGGPFAAHAGLVRTLAFAPDGTRLLTGGDDGLARLWDLAGRPLAVLRGHRGPVQDVAFDPTGRRLLTASSDGTARLWDASGTQVRVLRGDPGGVRRARFARDGKRLLTLGRDGAVRLRDADGGHGRALPGGPYATALFLGTGRHLLTLDDAGRARVDDLQADPPATSLRVEHVGAVRAWVAGGGAFLLRLDGRVDVLDGEGRRRATLRGHAARVLDAAWSPATKLVATASLDGSVRLWREDGTPEAVLEGHGLAVVEVAFDGAGRRLVSLGADGRARVWSADGHALASLEGPPLRHVGFEPGGGRAWGAPRGAGRLLLFDAAGHVAGALSAGRGDVLDVRAGGARGALAVRTADLCVHVLVTDGRRLLGAPGADPAAAQATPLPPLAEGPPPALPGDALGADGCVDCHRREVDLWAASNHARTFEPARPDNLPRDVREERTVEHPPGRTSFRMAPDGAIARTLGPDGAEHDYDLGWVAGRRRIRMYVARMQDGRLQVLPSMRAVPTDTWFDYTDLLFGGSREPPRVAPGDDAFWTGAVRSWGSRCVRCHGSGARPRAPFLDGPGPRFVERDLGVDCEACHGPGRRHAEAWRRLETDAPLLKLGRLPRDEQVAACTRCHMEAEVVRAGAPATGDLLERLDPTLLLDPQRVDARGRETELIYHGLSFAISRCATKGGLTCTRCHDAHGGPHPALLGKEPTNDALCGACHEAIVRDAGGHSHHDPDGPGALCTSCHLPKLVIERGHGVITDHTFGIPDPRTPPTPGQTDACRWCHGNGLGSPLGVPVLPGVDLLAAWRRWWPNARPTRPWMDTLEAARAGAPDAPARLVALLRDRGANRFVRASAARMLQAHADSAGPALLEAARDADSLVRRSALRALAGLRSPAADAALAAGLEDPSAAVRFAAARAALEGWKRVQENHDLLAAILPVLAEDADALPNDEMRWFRLGAARGLAGDDRGSLEAYERMLALHPLARNVRRSVKALRARLGGR
jgi:predicted CXXCH cytochrome family protein